MKFPVAFLEEVVSKMAGGIYGTTKVVVNEAVSMSRWTIQKKCVFLFAGKFYRVYYSRRVKARQKWDTFYSTEDVNGIEMVACQECRPIEVTTVFYEAVH